MGCKFSELVLFFWVFFYRERDPSSHSKGLINQLVGEKVTRFGISAAVNIELRTLYFVGTFDFNMPTDQDTWNRLKKKEKRGLRH